MKRNTFKKVAAVLLAVVMLVGCSIGATLAYLKMKTAPVVNTFTSSDISITLVETAVGEGSADANSYKMVPGGEITKDPKVTVEAGSEACWLFVKLDKSANYSTYLNDYALASVTTGEKTWAWEPVEGTTNVYCIQVSADDAKTGVTYQVLANNTLTVKTSVTKADMEAIESSNQPTLTITAYAVQQLGFSTPKAAWEEAEKLG